MAVFTSTKTAKNAFLEEHPQITRMPTTQREWMGFIQTLQRWTPDYQGSIDMTGLGFAADPVDFDAVLYHRYGKIVIIEFPVVESTSDNASLFSVSSLPADIRPTRQQIVPCPGLVDNGTPITGCGQARVGTNGTISLGLDNNGGGWTASGQKGFGDNTGNCIVYSLHDADKTT